MQSNSVSKHNLFDLIPSQPTQLYLLGYGVLNHLSDPLGFAEIAKINYQPHGQ